MKRHMIYYDIFDQEKLLNPHGSDETLIYRNNIPMTRVLLNPHGSDETFIITISTTRPYHLLNPHGSDETVVWA